MLNKNDVKGLYTMMCTPTKHSATGWDATDVINLDETARVVEEFVKAGVGGFALLGTTGENGCLLWEEKQKFIATVCEVNKHRVPVWAGTTTLGTRDTIRQMRGMKAVGADGTFNGLPLWQTPSYLNSTDFYKDLGEAVPDMAILVYANMRFFKMKFLADWWQLLVSKATTVTAAKISYSTDHLEDDTKFAGHKIKFIPSTGPALDCYKRVGSDHITAAWSTTASCGPEPLVAFANALVAKDLPKMEAINNDLKQIISHIPENDRPGFDIYNSQSNKYVTNLCKWMDGGPLMRPYHDLPDAWKHQAELSAKSHEPIRRKYMKVGAK